MPSDGGPPNSSKPIVGIDRRLLLRLMAASGYAVTAGPLQAASAKSRGHRFESSRVLLDRFLRPPKTADLGAYWYWLGGNVTAEGITADLEAMHEAGISQPMLFSIGKSDKNSLVSRPADALTDYWWQLVEHAIKEAGRLGLTMSLNCCDGWATASGPWITPELSMQHVVWSALTVNGGEEFSGTPAQPPSLDGYYRDIAVLALPFPEEWSSTSLGARITTNLPLVVADPKTITDAANEREIVDTEQDGWITYAFSRPFTLRSITVRTPSPPGFSPGVYRAANSLEVEASDDGATFRTIGRLEYPKHGWQTDLTTLTHAVPQTTARYFRLVHHKIPPQPYEEEYDFGQDTRLRFFSIVLSSEPRIHQWQGKTGEQWAISRETTAADAPDEECVKLADIVDLTTQFSPDGTLKWRAPPGRWRILRLGYTTTGKTNSAAGGAQGLECDRFNADAVKLQFDSWFGKTLSKVGPRYAGKVLHCVHVDSWEAGTQNWSPRFAEKFQELRGYDLLAWLPVMAGVPVESAKASERVLFDVRRTISDLTSANFFRTIADLAHANGCIFSGEPAAPTFLYDSMEYAAYVDLPMGEFWLNTPRNDKPTDIKDAVSGARVYGKPIAAAEAFTEGLMTWRETPFTMKALGDHNYCQGINRFMLHVYAQQPWLDREPGMTLNGIGSFFSRTQTWWKPGKAWFSYLRRCQALLQAGHPVIDVCAFTGENVPARALLPRNINITMPAGYAYDSINRDVLLNRTHVENGEIVLESGMRYRVLLLPDVREMTPQLASKLRELVVAGATVVGPPPERSPSMELADTADGVVRAVARELWDDLDGRSRTERSEGLGRVLWGKPLQALFAERGLPPDFETRPDTASVLPPGAIEWTHRRGEGWDIYFLSNQSGGKQRFEAVFRVERKQPEIWHPDSAQREELAYWRLEGGRTVISLAMEPAESLFVVFQKSAGGGDPIVAIEEGDRSAISLQRRLGRGISARIERPGKWRLRRRSGQFLTVREHSPLLDIPVRGPWTLRFAEHLPSPAVITCHELKSWTELSEPKLKYYSGTATYSTAFDLSRGTHSSHRLILDLGDVHDLARIKINRRSVTTLWKPPFVVDVTEAMKEGMNKLEIEVTNTWNNRLIGDSGKSGSDRVTYVVPMLRKGQPWLPSGDADLVPAGLLGPVRIRPVAVHNL